jgi:hypothetical protein
MAASTAALVTAPVEKDGPKHGDAGAIDLETGPATEGHADVDGNKGRYHQQGCVLHSAIHYAFASKRLLCFSRL